jgi:hypothetical protein
VRKILIGSVLGALAAGSTMLMPGAHAVSECGTGATQPSLGSTSGTVRVGVSGYGCITGSGSLGDPSNPTSPSTLTGFVIADGNPSNPGQSGGYIGVVRGQDGTVSVIGCGSGDASETNGGRGSNAPGDHVNNDLSANPSC